jgi:hypothetical protein
MSAALTEGMEPVAWLNYLNGEPYELGFKDWTQSNAWWLRVNPEAAKGLSCAPLYTADQLAAAVLAERERCAKICENARYFSRTVIAAAIRGQQ